MTGAIRVLVGIPAVGFVLLAATPIEPSVMAPVLFILGGISVWLITLGFKFQERRKYDRYDRSLAQSFVEADTDDCVEEGFTGEEVA